MATKKDLVEAYSFSRRRLVTAFLSGAPGGREVEPARPGRTVVGGLALAVLLVAGAAIASVLAARTEEDWNKIGLVVSKQEPAPYAILDTSKNPTLIPVINYTSAQLIFGVDVKPTYVDQSVIDKTTPGLPIGISGAPQVLPRPSQFINQGWTSCTGDGLGMTLDVSRAVHTRPEPARGVTVKTPSGEIYVIAKSGDADPDRRAYAYPVPTNGVSDDALAALGVSNRESAIAVPEAWVQLFPSGGPLGQDGFAISDFGAPATVAGAPKGSRIGDYWVFGNRAEVLTGSGLMPLDSFALKVYQSSQFGADQRPPRLRKTKLPHVGGAAKTYLDSRWPQGFLHPLSGQVCAELSVHHGSEPRVELRGTPGSAAAASPNSTPGSHVAFAIDRGQGAYVTSGDWNQTAGSTAWVIDASGHAYQLLGADTLKKLGYDAVAEPLVPDTWMKLFKNNKVTLSASAALCPPSEAPATNQTCHTSPDTSQ